MQICVWPLLFANKSASMADAFSLTTAMRFLRGESERVKLASCTQITSIRSIRCEQLTGKRFCTVMMLHTVKKIRWDCRKRKRMSCENQTVEPFYCLFPHIFCYLKVYIYKKSYYQRVTSLREISVCFFFWFRSTTHHYIWNSAIQLPDFCHWVQRQEQTAI